MASAFSPVSTRFGSRMALSMTAPPGMKPMFDGTFKKAGEHPTTFSLEHENGARAIVDTETATCISWKTPAGKELITGKGTAHMLNGAPLKGHFVPEERAKKMTFDRMIFKATPEDNKNIEYRVDVTMRDSTLEYDVTIKNSAATAQTISMACVPHTDAAVTKITKMTGFKTNTGTSVETGSWDVPVGKFKETAFYVLVEGPK